MKCNEAGMRAASEWMNYFWISLLFNHLFHLFIYGMTSEVYLRNVNEVNKWAANGINSFNVLLNCGSNLLNVVTHFIRFLIRFTHSTVALSIAGSEGSKML